MSNPIIAMALRMQQENELNASPEVHRKIKLQEYPQTFDVQEFKFAEVSNPNRGLIGGQ
jgi:hypothetical protein